MENYISVTQLNNYIKGIFDAEQTLHGICVYGEVTSYKISNGIAYFNIKEEDNLLPCVLFGALKFPEPNIGDVVLLTGSISYYVKGGKLSFNATKIEPYGKGLLYQKFLELKNKLELLGYFDVSRKKQIPDFVKRIGVVTSSTGAVIQDIIDVTTRRNDTIDIVLYPVKVQGVGAEIEIARGIDFFSEYENVDVVIVARGGGSMEDLQPFNTEVVAEATYKCKKPIVSAVGHETDYTIIDFVSDLRAPTPSAAAELVAWSKKDTLDNIYKIVLRMEKSLNNIANQNLNYVERNLKEIEYILNKKIADGLNKVHLCYTNMNNSVNNKCVDYENKVKLFEHTLLKLNPSNLLLKGYTKLELNGNPVKGINDINVGDIVSVRLKDGRVSAEVKDVDKENK